VAVSAALARQGDRYEVTLRNEGDETVRFSTAFLVPSIAFEVVDGAGQRVRPGPPPVPPADLATPMVELAPGEATTLTFGVNELPSGQRVRFAGEAPEVPGAWSGTITSDWIES
jgi:hypothetical protein